MDRNNTHLNRGEELRAQILEAQRSRQNVFSDRIERGELNRQLAEREDVSAFRKVAQIATLGVATYALGKAIPKDIWIDSLHKLGQFGTELFGKNVNASERALIGLRGRGLRSRGGTTELIDVIEQEANHFLRDVDQSTLNRSAREEALLRTRRILQERFEVGRNSTSKHTGLTVSDVLSQASQPNGNSYHVMSDRSIETLRKFRARVDPNGSWFDQLVVDRHLHVSKGGIGGQLIDTRWASRRALGEKLYNGLGFQIPYVGFKPIDLLAPLFRLGGKRESFVKLGQNQAIAHGLSTPKTGFSYLLNGEAYHIGTRNFTALAPGRKFQSHAIDSIAKANLGRLGAHPIQKIVANQNSSFESLQEMLGIGPMYREEPFAGAHFVHKARIEKGLRDNTIRWEPRANLRAVDVPVAYRSKLQKISSKPILDEDILSNPYKDFGDMPYVERVKAKYGHSTYGSFVDKQTGKSIEDVGKINIHAQRPRPSDYGYVRKSTANGQYMESLPYTVYEKGVLNKLELLTHFATNRLNQLIGATLGVGFKPTAGRFGAFWNAAKIAAIGAIFDPMNGIIVDAFKYVNYLFQRYTGGLGYLGDGVSPEDILIKGYEGITLGAAAIKDITGITAASKYIEGLLPGTIESPLSGFARTLGPIALGSRFGPKGLLAGLGFAGLTGGISDIFGTNVVGAKLTTSSSELLSLYSGDSKERIRSSRWWMLGRQNFYGEGTDRFEANWVALAKSDWEYTSSLFGSKKEYFEQISRLPTFHNLFGLGRDENYYAEKHATQRPYLEAPDGTAMHVGEMVPGEPSYGQAGLETLMGAGYMPPEKLINEVGSQTSLSNRIKNTILEKSEFLGVYKFLGETILGKPDSGPVMANASSITDLNRIYWDKDVGGLFGMTELLRRYRVAPNEMNYSEFVNNVPNEMPLFMPGSRSMFAGDRDYFKDFTLGDPFTKVKGGEYRLPGAGYEAVNELHSGRKGVYDSVDALLILADVAPYSDAYKFYKRAVSNMTLTDEWREKVNNAIGQRDFKNKGFAVDFAERRFSGDQSAQDSISNVNSQIKYNAVEQFIGKQYERLTLDIIPEAGRVLPFGTILTHKLFPHHTAEQDYLERVVHQARYSNWSNPYEGFIRPRALTLLNENPLTAGLGGSMLGLISANPSTRFALSVGGGLGMSTASAIRASNYGSIEGGYIPDFRKNEEAVLDYFDKLEYMRYEYAANRAEAMGNYEASSEFKKLQRKKTMVGLDYNNPMALKGLAMGALPKQERAYFDAFANASEDRREAITRMSPQYMQNIYKNIWERRAVEIDKNAAMADFLMNNSVPDSDWAGWNPGIEKWQIMSRSMDTADNSMAIDLNRQYVSNAMMAQARMQYPDVGLDIGHSISEESRSWHEATREKQEIEMQMKRSGFTHSRVRPYQEGGRSNRSSYRINKER